MSVEYVPLRYVTSVLARGTAPSYVENGPIRMVNQAANQNSGLDWGRTRFHNFAGDPRKLKGYLEFGDSLVNSTGTGTLGRIGWFEKSPDDRPCVADGHVTVTRFDPTRVDKRFGFYYLQSDEFQEFMFETLVNGSTNQIELSRERMSAVSMPVPPLEEQRRIADFLDAETARIDRLVNLRKRQVDLVEERHESALECAFSMATHRKTRLKYLLAMRPRYGVLVPSFVDNGVRMIRINDLTDLSGRARDMIQIPAELSAQYSRTVTRAGDVLLSVVGTMGRAAVVPDELAGANVNRAVALLRVMPDVPAELLAAWLTTTSYLRQAMDATASDTAQRTLGMEDLANFELSWPDSSDDLHKLRVAVRASSDRKSRLVAVFGRQINLLKERRQALITAAVTGEFDVSAASGRGIEE